MSKNFIIIFLIILVLGIGMANLAWAAGTSDSVKDQGSESKKSADLENPLGNASTISSVVGRIIKAFLGIIGAISLVMFIYAGFLLLTSGGSAGKIKTGQQTMVWAAIGILVVFASYAILKFVFSVVGL